MNRFFVKIGKFWSLVRRDGFLRALRRGFGYFASSVHRVGEGQVLLVSGGIGDSALYRSEHVAEELNQHGFIASSTVQDNPFLFRYIDRFDVFIFHRVSCTDRLMRFIVTAKRKGKKVLFETDDLTFDKDLMHKTSAFENMNVLERSQYEKGQSHCLVNDHEIAYATTTTHALAAELEKKGKKVFVVPNKLSENFLQYADQALEQQPNGRDGIFRIGYFSGSATHDRDFAVVSDVMVDVLKKYPHVHFFVAGPLTLPHAFARFGARVERSPYVEKAEHFQNIAKCDLTIAPLEVGDPFCESKSAIKYYEAGIVGVPTIASATKEFSGQIIDGKTGFVAHDEKEWLRKISWCLENALAFQEIGQSAREDVITHHMTQSAGNEDFYDFLRDSIDRSIVRHVAPLVSIEKEIDTAIVIVNWNGKALLKKCLHSLQLQTDQDFAVIVVDNGSTDESYEDLHKEFPMVSWILLGNNSGFAHATNVGFRAALNQSCIKYVVALNNDTRCDEDYIKKLREKMTLYDGGALIGALQPKVINYFEKGKIDSVGVVTSFEMSALNKGIGEVDHGQYDDDVYVFGPSASAALYTREALEWTMLPHDGFFDGDYFAYYEDVDLAWRLQSAGYETLFVPEAVVHHVHSATGGNASPFKAFYIHRNHFFNILKNVPLYYLPLFLLFIPLRYVLAILSVLRKKGPAARLHAKIDETKKENDHVARDGESLVSIVLRSWKEIIISLPLVLRKRQFISSRARRSPLHFMRVMRMHYVSLIRIIFR